MKKFVGGMLIAAAAVVVPFSVGAGTAAATDSNVTGPIPLAQCRAEAARLDAQAQPAPEQTVASGVSYYCYEHISLGGLGVVRKHMWNT